MSRSRLLLLLLILLGFASWYGWQQTPRQQRVASVSKPGSETSVVAAETKKQDSLDFSGGESVVYRKPQRDLFATLYPAPVVKKLPPPPPKPVVKPLPKPTPKPKPVVKPVVTGLKPIQPLTVLGFLLNGDEKTVFLASREGEVFLVKQGDRFADDLLVREIGDTRIVISRNDTDKGVTLQFAESKTQTMAIPNISSGRPSVPEFTSPSPSTAKPAGLPGQE